MSQKLKYDRPRDPASSCRMPVSGRLWPHLLRLAPLAALVLLGLPTLFAQQAPPSGFVVIVHQDNPADELKVKDVAKMFTKQKKRWPDREAIDPVDQAPGSAVREAFTRAVHRKSVDAIKSFWQRMIFSGDGVPPLELASNSEVLTYIREHPHAVGYVSDQTALGANIKALKILY